MNVVLHALVGGAIAHAVVLASAGRSRPGLLALSGAALASVASHGVLDWLRHGYPVPSVVDVALAMVVPGVWLLRIRPPLRLLFAVSFAGSFLPDVVDHLPRLLQLPSFLSHPVFPWHSPAWSGSLYPAAHIRPGSHLVALERGNNAFASTLNHVMVIAAAAASVFVGRAAFKRE